MSAPNILGWTHNAALGRHERAFGDLAGCVWDLGTGFWAGELSSPAGRLARLSCGCPATAARMVERAAREHAAGRGLAGPGPERAAASGGQAPPPVEQKEAPCTR
jgi:hypothetical protein